MKISYGRDKCNKYKCCDSIKYYFKIQTRENNSFTKNRGGIYFVQLRRLEGCAWTIEGGVERNTPLVVHVFNNLLLGSCSGQLRPARTRGPPPLLIT